MPVNTIEVPTALQEVIDEFILADPTREYGGFLFGTPLRFETFLPVPNVSATPKSRYEMPMFYAVSWAVGILIIGLVFVAVLAVLAALVVGFWRGIRKKGGRD